MIHVERAEAAVGQNISLPCLLNDTLHTNVIQIEWRKKPSTKLVVHHAQIGPYYYRSDVVFLPENGDDNKLKGSYLQIFNTQVNDSGKYVCELTTYPHGSISRETLLEVKGKK